MVWFPPPPTINTPPFRWPEPRPRIYPTGRMPTTNAPVYAPDTEGLWPLGAEVIATPRTASPSPGD